MHRLITIIMLHLLCFNQYSYSTPILMPTNRLVPIYNSDAFQTRGPFDFIGNWIQSSDWFPIEINVPDTISGIGQGINNGWTNLQNGWSNFLQNIPWFNRFNGQRPYKIIVLVPKNMKQPNFNPFHNDINHFPIYP